MPTTAYPAAVRPDVETLWQYNQLHHDIRPTDVGIGLGSHDLGVATHAADLFRSAMFPRIVFTGANAPTTAARFPRGEAVHYREHAIERGVPAEAIILEPRATNTTENIQFTRNVLESRGLADAIRSLEAPACGTVASVPAEATNDGMLRRFICDRPADHRTTGNPKHRHIENADTAHCVEWTDDAPAEVATRAESSSA
jgi:hypothetical protein